MSVTIPIAAEAIETALAAGEANFVRFLEQHPTNGYLYGLTILNPAKLIKVSKTDFADRTVITFANDGFHKLAAGLRYSEANDRFYALMSDGSGNFIVSEIHPVTLVVTDVIASTPMSVLAGGNSLEADGTNLYILGRLAGASLLMRCPLNNLSAANLVVTDLAAQDCGSAIRYASGKLYIVGKTGTDPELLIIETTGFTIESSTPFPPGTSALSSQEYICPGGDYVFASFGASPEKFWSFHRTTLAVAQFTTGLTVASHGSHAALISDGDFVWALMSLGVAIRITPSTTQQALYSLTPSYLSGIVGDDNYIYGAIYGSPTTIARYRVVPYGALKWVTVLPATGINDFANCVTIDPLGNILYGGSLNGYIFYSKYTYDGVEIFTKSYGTGFVTGIVTDAAGNIYITGEYNGAANFGGGIQPGSGPSDIFVAKFNSAGVYVWAVTFVGTQVEGARAITIDGNGDLLITGSFYGQVNFGGTQKTAAGASEVFVLKLDPNDGSTIWVVSFGNPEDPGTFGEVGLSVTVNSGNDVIVSGVISGSVNFGGGVRTGSGQQGFIVKLNGTNGAWVWDRVLTLSLRSVFYGVKVFNNGDIAAVGTFYGASCDLGNGVPIPGTGRYELVFARYAALDGAYVWGRAMGADAQFDDICSAIALDEHDNMYVTGYFIGSRLDLGNGVVAYGRGPYALIAKLNSSGVAIWAKGVGGESNTTGRSIATDGRRVFVAGQWYDYVDFGDGVVRRHVGAGDLFVLALAA